MLWAVAIHIAKLQLRGLWLGSEDQTATDGLREDSIVVDDDDDDDSDDGNEASVAESGKDTKKNPWQVIMRRLIAATYIINVVLIAAHPSCT